MRRRSLLAPGLGLALGAALAFFSGRGIHRAWVSDRWPTASGVVTGSHMEVTRSWRQTQYLPRIEYRYSVNGQEFTSDVLSFSALGTSAQTAREWIARYPRGSRVEVHYAPDDPRIACVSCRPPGWRDVLAAVAGAAVAIFSATAMAQAFRSPARSATRQRMSEMRR